MSHKIYPWHQKHHNQTPFGAELARKVADFLLKGKQITYTHRDYCGMGLVHHKGIFLYGTVHDGYDFFIEKNFSTQTDFENWLASQSDKSLCGKELEDSSLWDNQRITEQRLFDVLENPPSEKTIENFFVKKDSDWEKAEF